MQEIDEKLSKKKNGKTMKVVNENTGKTHNYNTRTFKDEFNSYPPWLNVGNHKRKIKRKKTAMKKNQFYTGAVHIGIGWKLGKLVKNCFWIKLSELWIIKTFYWILIKSDDAYKIFCFDAYSAYFQDGTMYFFLFLLSFPFFAFLCLQMNPIFLFKSFSFS